MWRYTLLNLLLGAALAPTGVTQQEPKPDYTTEAGIDSDGNVYVSSDEGKPLKMARVAHCVEAKFADDKQTVGCSVARGTTKPEETMQSLRLEIYLRNGKKKIIETETPMMDWHFWRDGKQVAVYWRLTDGKEHYALYDSASARLIEELAGTSDEGLLPEWAKSRAQLQDESVPMGDDYAMERTRWVAKVLRQIAKIEPGMKRRDLLKVLTTEGGLSTRFHRTYVYSECPYIKVNVWFKAANNEGNGVDEDPDDTIESISQPYLAWSAKD
jgi:hypothetical protein